MQSSLNPFSKHPLALATAVFAFSLGSPASAQESTPGWLDWGGDSSGTPQEQAPERQPARTRPVADQAVPEAATGQAALLQRLMRRVDSLESEVRELRGQLSEQARELDRQKQAHERALRKLEARGPANPPGPMPANEAATESAPGESAASATGPAQSNQAAAAPADAVSDEEQQALYNQAFETLKSGEYDQAVEAFQRVIDANPQGSWAPSAFFWQGETHYVQRDYRAAAKSYAELLERYPESNRVPDATLKLGYIAQEQDRIDEAKRRFNTVIEQYPDSQAAGLARQRLDRLGG